MSWQEIYIQSKPKQVFTVNIVFLLPQWMLELSIFGQLDKVGFF